MRRLWAVAFPRARARACCCLQAQRLIGPCGDCSLADWAAEVRALLPVSDEDVVRECLGHLHDTGALCYWDRAGAHAAARVWLDVTALVRVLYAFVSSR